jgi:acetyl esterase
MTESSPPATILDPEMIAAGVILRSERLVALDPRTSALTDVRALQDRIGEYLSNKVPRVAVERDVLIPGPNRDIPCRLYAPESATPVPLLIYFHGGGFIYGRAQGWDGLMRELVRQSRVAVLNVDYCLAPDHKFPAGLTEAVAVIDHVKRTGAQWGIDVTRLAAGGDSAGANLALVAEMIRRDRGETALQFLLLFYGVFSGDTASASWVELGSGTYGLSQGQMEWIWSTYLQAPIQRDDWRATPLSGNLTCLPEIHQIIGTLDPLLDDAYALKLRLDAAGVKNDLVFYPGVNHGFIRFNRMVAMAQRAVDDAAVILHRALSVEGRLT